VSCIEPISRIPLPYYFFKGFPHNTSKTCSDMSPQGIDRVVVTDHNTIEGALAGSKTGPGAGHRGRGNFDQPWRAPGRLRDGGGPSFPLSPGDYSAAERIRGRSSAFRIRFDRFRSGAWEEDDLLEILPQVDAIEVFNSRCFDPRFNREAREFAEKHDIPGTVGSDAHAAFELGRSLLCWTRSTVQTGCERSSERESKK
jgi:hypothetical protein